MKQYAGKHQKEPGHLTCDTTSPVDNVRSPDDSTVEIDRWHYRRARVGWGGRWPGVRTQRVNGQPGRGIGRFERVAASAPRESDYRADRRRAEGLSRPMPPGEY